MLLFPVIYYSFKYFSVKYLGTYFHHLWMPTQGRRFMWVGLPSEYAEQTLVGGWGAQTLGGSSHPRGHQGHPGIQQDLLPILFPLLHHRLRCQAKFWFENECQRNMKWWGGVTSCEWQSQEGQEPDLDQFTAGRCFSHDEGDDDDIDDASHGEWQASRVTVSLYVRGQFELIGGALAPDNNSF